MNEKTQRLRTALITAINMLKHYGEQPPDHSCGPESNCDQLCADYANFEQQMFKLKKALEGTA